MIFILYGFAVAWLIYGNVLVWNDAYKCRYNTPGAEKVWRLYIAIITIGYAFFLIQLMIYICLLVVLGSCIMKKCGKEVPHCCLRFPWIKAIPKHKVEA
jgi:hypothetical protein